LALEAKLSSPIGPLKAVPELFVQDAVGLLAVKNVTFSLFTSSFTRVFTLWPRTPLKEIAMPGTKPQEQQPENYPNGRE
jgi:hypothetical protein